jgi:predicted transcriptional regulator
MSPQSCIESNVACMGKTKRKPETIYIDDEKFERLKQLAKTTRIPRAVLWREALDDLLMKHEVPKETQRYP